MFDCKELNNSNTFLPKSCAARNIAVCVAFAAGWQNLKVVPEPTSGLLMLLGMARPRLRFGCVRALREPPPGGEVPDPPFVNIEFQDDEVLAITPEVKFSSRVTANVVESSDPPGNDVIDTKPIGSGGTFNFGAKSDTPRFYRITAEME